MYSSIEEDRRYEVIEKCYWPLFKLADKGIPFGLEAPAVTLEIIQQIDQDWINNLSQYIKNGKIEFIGSGYSQLICPLVPAQINQWNQKIGIEIYNKLLSIQPKLALVNEMAYSSGIVEHYINNGYQGIIMEWNNPRSAYPEWKNEWRYYPQKAIGPLGSSIPLIWADSIAFQKFQRYAHNEYTLDEYVAFIKKHFDKSERYFPLYSNDVEIFDYRPGRYQTEAKIVGKSEWDRIFELYNYLHNQDWCKNIFPSQVLDDLDNEFVGTELKLESPSQPIPVKKQEKYNINRWALTGRDDMGINSKCYKIYNSFVDKNNNNPEDWKELCYLWSSDFRTHITEKRWNDYYKRLDSILIKCNSIKTNHTEKKSNKIKVFDENKHIRIENNHYLVVLNKNKGLTIQKLVIKKISKEPILGMLDHGYYDDISLGADYYSGHTIIERPGQHKVTDLGKILPKIVKNDDFIDLQSEQKCNGYLFRSSIKLKGEKIIIEKNITSDTNEKSIIRPYNFTLNPLAWDQNSLYISTHNGGTQPEIVYLKGQKISHSDIYSSLISSRHGFGNTNGVLVVGDNKKTIAFVCDMTSSALIPSIIYKEMDGTYFFRLQYSAQEIDETARANQNKICANITLII